MKVPENIKQVTDTILMVRPVDFCFNSETASDNEFQRLSDEPPEKINQGAMVEFENMVRRLRHEKVNVLVLEKGKTGVKTPDAVFPNNWISTEHDGSIITYPMAARNRRAEKRRIHDAENLFTLNGYLVKNVINIGLLTENKLFLEGTGSMIIDHDEKTIYMAESLRSAPSQLKNFMQVRPEYRKAVIFQAQSSGGRPIYHTNIIMSIGYCFAVICQDCISYNGDEVVRSLKKNHEIINISQEQMEDSLCGNILQLKSIDGDSLIVMSESAFKSFSDNQMKRLEQYGKIINIKLETIERIGGGSARCMIAEVFLPFKNG